MKKILMFFLLTANNIYSFAQVSSDSVKHSIKTDYLQKSRNQNTAGWFLLGGGALLDVIAIASYPKSSGILSSSPSEQKQAQTSGWLFVAGTASMLGSIPFFIVSHVNKKKSVSIAIDTQPLQQLKSSALHTINYPSLALKVRL